MHNKTNNSLVLAIIKSLKNENASQLLEKQILVIIVIVKKHLNKGAITIIISVKIQTTTLTKRKSQKNIHLLHTET